jgi:ketosteroid isomerase-like protein
VKPLLLLAIFFFCPLVWAYDCPSNQAKDGDTLLQIEQAWAKALQQKNADAVACIIGDGFEDASTDGQVYDRDTVLAHIPQRHAGSNTLSDMKAHIYGDSAYVRGVNTVKDADGKTLAQVRFTDIFVYQNGIWKAVAGHETLVSVSTK